MAKGGLGGMDSLVPVILVGGLAYVLYFAISGGSNKGKLCGGMNPIDVESRRSEKAAIAAQYIKTYSKAPSQLKTVGQLTLTIRQGYPSAIDNLVRLAQCGFTRDVGMPPAFWKAMASLIITYNSHNLSVTTQLRPTALAAVTNMRASGNVSDLNSSYTKVSAATHSYATGQEEVISETPEGFKFADAIINVFDQTYKLKPEEQGGIEDYDVANADNPVTVKS